MAFYVPDDPDYQSAKRVRRGEARIDPAFSGFVDRFRGAFGVPPLALNFDIVGKPGGGKMPRLGVVLERSAQHQSFLAGEYQNYDPEKQDSIVRMLVESTAKGDLRKAYGLSPLRSRQFDWASEIFVYFEDFERTAKWDAHEQVQGEELESFLRALELGDQFWCTERFSGPPIVFVFTEKQAQDLRESDVQETWADLYFPIVQRHDEFGYLLREEIFIQVDSKQNFDENYSSNWYYYFK